MTRIFGYERQTSGVSEKSEGENNLVLKNMRAALVNTYVIGRHVYGMGFMIIPTDGTVKKYSIYKGYRGILVADNIYELLPKELLGDLEVGPKAVVAVLQNDVDQGAEHFASHDGGRTFPLESPDWYAVTIGDWGVGGFKDENTPWYEPARPSKSILNYLETNPKRINFDWIDPCRTAYIVAVKKDGKRLLVEDQGCGKSKGYKFKTESNDYVVRYLGLRDREGNIV